MLVLFKNRWKNKPELLTNCFSVSTCDGRWEVWDLRRPLGCQSETPWSPWRQIRQRGHHWDLQGWLRGPSHGPNHGQSHGVLRVQNVPNQRSFQRPSTVMFRQVSLCDLYNLTRVFQTTLWLHPTTVFQRRFRPVFEKSVPLIWFLMELFE